jgi:DNA-binding MarR family transcriptional regulator
MPLLTALSLAARNEISNGKAIMLLMLLKGSSPETRFDSYAICTGSVCSKAAVSRMFDSICSKGFAHRVRDEKDRRYIRAWLTPKGEDLVKLLEAA